MPVLLILLVATVVELTVLIAVGHAIGVLATIALLILASLVGAALLRSEGARTLSAFLEALRTRRPPHQELLDGMLIAIAGVLIVLPGFVSDILGLLLLLPPIRAVVRRRMLRAASLHTPPLRTPRLYAPGSVVEGEVVDESSAPRSSTGELH
ncbi:MAG TPA: FxsA family protein [Pseudonocardiaceae bacterium]|nr:FxsA family protein [Pseudonocardiaceae bacterium]